MDTDSISEWIIGLKGGDPEAANRLWQRFAAQLLFVAEKKLAAAPEVNADQEDIAQSVFASICRGAAAGRFEGVINRHELWWLLLAITRQKSVDLIRRELAQKRGAGRVQSESALCETTSPTGEFKLDNLVSDEPSPAFLIILEEEHQRLLELLRDDTLRRIATWRVEGYSVAEIAEKLAISTRSVERKLELIRKKWATNLRSE